jgi:hypothetical protein
MDEDLPTLQEALSLLSTKADPNRKTSPSNPNF